MNMRQLDCFIAVAVTLSFSAAANQLFLSQSAVSKQVSLLESELGYPLFERSKHHVKLTPAGEYLLPRVQEIRDNFRSALSGSAAIANNSARRLTLGYDGPLAENWIGTALSSARKEGAEFHLLREPLPQLTSLLVDNVADVIVTTDSEVGSMEEVRFLPLCASNPCVFFPKGHRFENRSQVSLEDLRDEPLVTAYESFSTKILSRTGSLLSEKGSALKDATAYPDGDTAFMAVQSGAGLFVASRLCEQFAARYNVSSADLDVELPTVTMGLAWKVDDKNIEALARAAKAAIKKA